MCFSLSILHQQRRLKAMECKCSSLGLQGNSATQGALMVGFGLAETTRRINRPDQIGLIQAAGPLIGTRPVAEHIKPGMRVWQVSGTCDVNISTLVVQS